MNFMTNLILISLLIFSNQSKAETVSREALFQRAFDSMGFILRVVKANKKFLNELSDDEKKTLNKVQPLVEKKTTYLWLKKSGYAYSQKSDKITFYYVTSKNQIRESTFPINYGFKMRFSDNLSDFDLKDGSPIRDAVTTESLQDDILVNRHKINQKSKNLTLGDAFSLMLHEFGHKLGRQNNQASLDSLASKIKSYIDQRIQHHEFNSGKVSVFKLLNSPFDPWAEAISYGLYQGVNVPFQFSEFSAHDNQGVWVFIENSSEIRDTTDLIFDKVRPLIDYTSDPRFHWAQMNWFMADEVQVQEKAPSQFQLEFNLNHLQFVVPFLKLDSPHPQHIGLYENLIRTQSFGGDFISFAVQIEHQSTGVKIQNRLPTPHRFQDPSFDVKVSPLLWRKDDLVFQFEIHGQHRNPIEENQNTPLRPVLILDLEGKKLEISSDKKSSGPIYEFLLPEVKKLGLGRLKVESLEMRPVKHDLTKMAHDFRVKLFMPKIDGINLSGTVSTEKTILISQKLEGSKLKIVLQTQVQLQSLQVLQSYELINQVSSILFPGRPEQKQIAGSPISSIRSLWLDFSKDEMTQRFESGHLIVEIDLDRNAIIKNSQTFPIYAGPILVSQETHLRFVQSERKIEAIQILTDNYQTFNTAELSTVLSCKQAVRK